MLTEVGLTLGLVLATALMVGGSMLESFFDCIKELLATYICIVLFIGMLDCAHLMLLLVDMILAPFL